MLIVAQHKSLFDGVIFICNELAKGTMHGVILTGLNFQRKNRQGAIVVNKEIHFALLLIVIIEHRETMRMQFLCDNRLVHCPKNRGTRLSVL